MSAQHDKVRDFYNKQAKRDPGSAGILSIQNDIESEYRQDGEWRTFRKMVPLSKDMDVLELGCGAGRWCFHIGPFVRSVHGVDISEELIDLAAQRRTENGFGNISFEVSDLTDFKPSKKYGLIYFSAVLQYLADNEIRGLLRKTVLCLADGGTFVDRSTVVTERGRLVRDEKDYFSIYRTREEISGLFREAGFGCIASARSHRYLSCHWLWKASLVGGHCQGCIKRAPWIVFRLMEGLSALSELVRGPSGRESDGTMYSHDFFVFRKE